MQRVAIHRTVPAPRHGHPAGMDRTSHNRPAGPHSDTPRQAMPPPRRPPPPSSTRLHPPPARSTSWGISSRRRIPNPAQAITSAAASVSKKLCQPVTDWYPFENQASKNASPARTTPAPANSHICLDVSFLFTIIPELPQIFLPVICPADLTAGGFDYPAPLYQAHICQGYLCLGNNLLAQTAVQSPPG